MSTGFSADPIPCPLDNDEWVAFSRGNKTITTGRDGEKKISADKMPHLSRI